MLVSTWEFKRILICFVSQFNTRGWFPFIKFLVSLKLLITSYSIFKQIRMTSLSQSNKIFYIFYKEGRYAIFLHVSQNLDSKQFWVKKSKSDNAKWKSSWAKSLSAYSIINVTVGIRAGPLTRQILPMVWLWIRFSNFNPEYWLISICHHFLLYSIL